MIESISNDSNLLTTVSTHYEMAAGRASETARTEENAPRKAEQEEIRAVYGSYDTVTISAAGSAYARQAAAAKAGQEGAETATAKTGDGAVSSAAKVSTDTAVKGTASGKLQADMEAETEAEMGAEMDAAALSEEASETEDLGGYTDAELKQMMYKGDITQSEYDEEMLSRNGFTFEIEE